jgi:hypothetical protein
MTISTIYTDASNQYIASAADQLGYAIVRNGVQKSVGGGPNKCGQWFIISAFYCWENFLEFDTSGLAGVTVDSVEFSLTSYDDKSTVNFITEVRRSAAWDTPGSLATSDWYPGGDLAALELCATWDSADYTGDSTREEFDSEPAFIDELDLTGTTNLIMVSKEMTDNSQPWSYEWCEWKGSTGAESVEAKLVVTHSDAPQANIGTHF